MKGEETLRSGGQVKSCLLPGEYARTAPKQSAGVALKSKVASHPPSPPLPYPPPDMKVTWRAAISGHKATFFSDSDFLDPVIPKMRWAPGNRCIQSCELSKGTQVCLLLGRR